MRAFWKRIFSPNATIVHRSLEDSRGVPKTGRIEELVDNQLVVAHFDNAGEPTQSEAYDRRELQRLIMIPWLSRGPVLLHPHHLWRVCRDGSFWFYRHLAHAPHFSLKRS